jgi:hypothetical protein
MTPRSGLYVSLVGLVMAGLATLSFLMDWNPYPVNHTAGAGLGFALFLIFVAMLGLIVIVAGLIIAGVAALTNRTGKAP